MEIPNQPNQKPKPLYNPLKSDFSWEYKDEDNQTHTAVLPAMDITYFPTWLADVLVIHLADAVYDLRGPKQNHELDIAEIKKEIEEIDL